MNTRRIIQHLLLTGCVAAFAACSNTKHLPANDMLYTGATIKITGTDAPKKQRKELRKELAQLTRPRPNKKILGIRLKLFFYNLAGNPKKENSPRGWFKRKLGEPPVLMSNVDIYHNSAVLQNYLQNKGFFQALVSADTVSKHKKAQAIYTANAGTQYTIRNVAFEVDSSNMLGTSILGAVPKTLLKPGKPYNLEVIKLERERIDAHLKEYGFYFFNGDNLLIEADTTVGAAKVDLFMKLKPGIPRSAQEMYTINKVVIFTNYRLAAQTASDTAVKDAVTYKGYSVVDRARRYKPKMFEQSMQFKPGDVYSRTDHNLSLNRLVTLNVFKFVKNRFEVDSSSPFARLNTFYYLTPLPKKSLKLEVNGNTKSNNLVGSQVSIAWRNRNTFRGGELFTINATGGAEVQYSSNQRGYNVYRAGIEASMTFPRFLIPFFPLNTSGGFVPKTTMLIGYDLLNKQQLYTLNSFRAAYGYSWKESLRKEHQFNPVSINYVQPVNVTPEYTDSAAKNPTLQKAIEKQFILGSTYNFTYNELLTKQDQDGIYFSGTLDLSGNVAGLLTGADSSKNRPGKVFNTVFSQYIKTELDFRFYKKLSEGMVWANRIITGLGYPYGNSRELPYIKQFFIGGNNSLRAFRSRSVGPGIYNGNVTSLIPDQSGDIKLELNTELRAKLFSIVQGALFVDAGNIWLYRKNPLKPGAEFTNQFLNQLAVGTGFGLRFDVSILVLRLDIAFPIRKPYLPEGERWVLNKVQLGNSTWRKENLVFNIAIGYPF